MDDDGEKVEELQAIRHREGHEVRVPVTSQHSSEKQTQGSVKKIVFLFFLVRSKFGLCRIIYSNINSLLVQFLSGFSRYHFPQNIQYEFNSPPLSHNLQRVLGAAQLTFWPRSLHSSLSSAALTDVSFESVLWCPEALSFVNLISRHLVQAAAFARPKLTFLHYS